MNIQSVSVIFVVIFLPLIIISSFFIQQEVDTISMQSSYDTKLIDATNDAVSAFEINTTNEDLSKVADQLRSMIEASNNVFINTLATNLGMSNASQSAILPFIPAVVYTLYDGYYIYSPTQQPVVLTDPNGVYVNVGDPCVDYRDPNEKDNGEYSYNYVEAQNIVDNPNVAKPEDMKASDFPEDYDKILYVDKSYNGEYIGDDKVPCVVDPDKAKNKTSYILKSFIPYSSRYKNDGSDGRNAFDVTINYTLDNFISVMGNIVVDNIDVYYTKSGYLINYDEIDDIKFNGTSIKKKFDYREAIKTEYMAYDSIDKFVKDNIGNNITIKFKNGITISTSDESAVSKNYKDDEIADNISAVQYYLKAYSFSTWFFDCLGDLKEKDIQKDYLEDSFKIYADGFLLDENNKMFYTYLDTDDSYIFKTSDGSGIDVRNSDSRFYEHKRNVIKNSIQYNLNLAMAVYNKGQGDNIYQMPLLSEKEWDKVLSNVSVISFLQGLPCGLKKYNNYAIVTSSNNNILANEDDIYYVPISNSNLNSEGLKVSESPTVGDLDTCHRLDCIGSDNDWLEGIKEAKYFISFPSKEIKYDKEYDATKGKYIYDHIVNSCYYCIVNSNYRSKIREYINEAINGSLNDGKIDDEYKSMGIDTGLVKKITKAEYIAVGKIRNNTYKSIEFTNNYGLYIDNYDNDGSSTVSDYATIKGKRIVYYTDYTIDPPVDYVFMAQDNYSNNSTDDKHNVFFNSANTKANELSKISGMEINIKDVGTATEISGDLRLFLYADINNLYTGDRYNEPNVNDDKICKTDAVNLVQSNNNSIQTIKFNDLDFTNMDWETLKKLKIGLESTNDYYKNRYKDLKSGGTITILSITYKYK